MLHNLPVGHFVAVHFMVTDLTYEVSYHDIAEIKPAL